MATGPRWLVLAALFLVAATATATDADALLAFKSTLLSDGSNNTLAGWVDDDRQPCRWTGVLCSSNGTVMGLVLENMNLSGPLRLDALAGIPGLRTLSLMNNSFTGVMPDLKILSGLRSVSLSTNNLSGVIADDNFAGMGSLRKIFLSHNRLSGSIPTSIIGLTLLQEVRLDGNAFTGAIPDVRLPELMVFNVSNNSLKGPIPESLSRFDPTSFEGNVDLCGAPLVIACKARARRLLG